mgnify:CR=1 FL=1
MTTPALRPEKHGAGKKRSAPRTPNTSSSPPRSLTHSLPQSAPRTTPTKTRSPPSTHPPAGGSLPHKANGSDTVVLPGPARENRPQPPARPPCASGFRFAVSESLPSYDTLTKKSLLFPCQPRVSPSRPPHRPSVAERLSLHRFFLGHLFCAGDGGAGWGAFFEYYTRM